MEIAKITFPLISIWSHPLLQTGAGLQRTLEENSYQRNTISRRRSKACPISLPSWYQNALVVMGQCFPRDECQGGSAGTRGLPFQGDEPCPAERTYLCKGPGVGSDQGRWPIGQAAVAPEPGSGRESGCLAGPRRPHDGPRPARARGTAAVSGRQRCGRKDPSKGDQPLKNQDSPMHFTRGR